jgi:catechol 2,3-dioxygenase-like lactoylglutathione lyase family enzyme
MSTITRRQLLLSLPGLLVARHLFALPGAAPVRILGLHHVTLGVSDVERSVEFYQRLFGMPVQARTGAAVLLRGGHAPQYRKIEAAGARPARIDRWGMSVEGFDVERTLDSLAEAGVSRAPAGQGVDVGALRARVTTRDGARELHMGDPNGLVVQLQDPSDCGAGGACPPPRPSPHQGDLSLRGWNHLTINVPDPASTNEFYQRAFGFGIRAYQGASPLLAVGPAGEFLMFTRAAEGAGPRIDHCCLTVDGFEVEHIQRVLESHGMRPRDAAGPGPLRHWVSMRMPNRGGAPEGTPELYFSDPDGLSIQLQHPTYCGGTGYHGESC